MTQEGIWGDYMWGLVKTCYIFFILCNKYISIVRKSEWKPSKLNFFLTFLRNQFTSVIITFFILGFMLEWLHARPNQDFENDDLFRVLGAAMEPWGFLRSHFALSILQGDSDRSCSWLEVTGELSLLNSLPAILTPVGIRFFAADLQPTYGTVLWGWRLGSSVHHVSFQPCSSWVHPKDASVTSDSQWHTFVKILQGNYVIVPREMFSTLPFCPVKCSIHCLL